MIRLGEPRRVGEVAPGHSETTSVAIHQIGERALVSGHELRESNCRVVPRLHDDPHEQGFDRDPGSYLDEHPGSLHSPGLLAHENFIRESELPRRHLREYDVARHHLGQARGLHTLVGRTLGEHATAVHVDEDMGLGIDLGGLGGAGRLHDRANKGQNQSGDESTWHRTESVVMDST